MISFALLSALSKIFHNPISIKKEKFLEDYEKKVNEIPIEKQCVPNLEIAGPIINHLKFKITEDTLREKYAKLLSEASNIDNLTKPLLSFDNVLNQLSPYEIELLTQLFENNIEENYALASIKEISAVGYRYVRKNVPNISFRNIKTNTISIMISNFERLGLIKISNTQFLGLEESYAYITKSSLFLQMKRSFQTLRQDTNQRYPDCEIEKGAFYLTDFGKSFVVTIID